MAVVPNNLVETGFPRVLWDCVQLCGFDRKPVYTMLELDVSETMTEYMEKVVVLGRPSLDRHPYHFIGPRMPSKSMAVELVAREAIRLLRDTLQGGISSSESN
jgi:hypothetical protein